MTLYFRSTENSPNYHNRVSKHAHFKAEAELKQPVNNHFPKIPGQGWAGSDLMVLTETLALKGDLPLVKRHHPQF